MLALVRPLHRDELVAATQDRVRRKNGRDFGAQAPTEGFVFDSESSVIVG